MKRLCRERPSERIKTRIVCFGPIFLGAGSCQISVAPLPPFRVARPWPGVESDRCKVTRIHEEIFSETVCDEGPDTGYTPCGCKPP